MVRLVCIAVGVVVAAWVAASLVLFEWPPARSAPPAHADAVVVLSGGLNARLDPALALMRRRIAPVLVVSGAFHDTRWKKARRLCRGGYAPLRFRVLCVEPHPYSTRGEARLVASLARRHGWRDVVVVTSTFHVTRAHLLFARCWDGALQFVGTGAPWWRLPEEWATETGKLLVQLTLQRHC